MQHFGAEEGGGAEALVLQCLRQAEIRLVHQPFVVGVHSVVRRVAAGEDGGMGGDGERHRGEGLPEEHSPAGQAIDVRGHGLFIAVAAETVSPGGVEGDQQQVRSGSFSGWCCRGGGLFRPGRTGREQQHSGEDQPADVREFHGPPSFRAHFNRSEGEMHR